MGMINIVKNVKEVHPEYVIIVNTGKFYYTYGKDSYIIAYLFHYQLSTLENVSRCGFSDHSLKKVMAKLEQTKINYLLLDRKNNYDVDEEFNCKNLNQYQKVFEKAREKINLRNRVDRICQYLYSSIDYNEKIGQLLKKMEEYIDEGRKI